MATSASLRSRRKLGGENPCIVGDRVVEVVEQVLQWALAGDDSLDEEPKHGEHGETAILDLLHLELSEGDRVVGKAERVEVLAAGVEVVALADTVETIDAEPFDQAHEKDLEAQHGKDALRVDEVGVPKVVEATLGEDLRAGLEPDGLLELDAHPLLEHLGEDAAKSAEHRPPPVDHLQRPVPSERLRVGGKPGGVPAVVARELAVQVGRRLRREGAQVLDAVRAVPQVVALRARAHTHQTIVSS
ncbi:hypothetical protein CFC21_009263 [Triticum aestivum]|uniref:Uncharacterized protein n=2 Tax=Triticum aestivum TaxID=4565 RepID=A0A3B5Z6C6_WHEAT|nr:hypothetical protein CFC21_009263 [Triticum aestivum]